VLSKRRGNVSFLAEGPLEQFQIDLKYLLKRWFNNGFKSIFACVDVISKKADMIPLKDREQTTTTKAFKKIYNNIGIPQTVYSDQGPEFKTTHFKKYYINIIFK
jgi:hypothetical protein